MGRRRVLLVAAGVLVAGAIGWGVDAHPPVAAANGTDGQLCTAAQVAATMVDDDQGASVHHATIRLASRAGEVCRVEGAPVATLQDAPDVVVTRDPTPGPAAVVTPATPVSLPVSWPDQGGAVAQQTPTSITLTMAGDSPLVVPWRGGAVDAGPGGHVSLRGPAG